MHTRRPHLVTFKQSRIAPNIGCFEILPGKWHSCFVFSPHCTHRLQPLDVGVFGPFQTATNKLCYDWIRSHPGRAMKIEDLSPIYARALAAGATEANIISSFRTTGIWPYDSQVLKDIEFLPSGTKNRDYTPYEMVDEDIPIGANMEIYEFDEFGECIDFDNLNNTMSIPHPFDQNLASSSQQITVQDLLSLPIEAVDQNLASTSQQSTVQDL